MVWYTAIFLGLVQGLAEFLPISSSGHLLLFQHLFGVTDGGLLFTIILHLATLLAVVVVYRQRLWQLIKRPFCQYNWQLLVATVITCGLVVCFKGLIDRLFGFNALPFMFILGGVYLLLPCVLKPRANQKSWLHAITMGVAQGVAVVPGLTRSGLTITTGQLSGMDKDQAADFSFLMSIPVIVASLVYELISGATLVQIGWGNLVLAFLTAFAAGIFAIKFMLRLLRQVDLRWFAVYLFILGGGLLLYRWFL